MADEPERAGPRFRGKNSVALPADPIVGVAPSSSGRKIKFEEDDEQKEWMEKYRDDLKEHVPHIYQELLRLAQATES